MARYQGRYLQSSYIRDEWGWLGWEHWWNGFLTYMESYGMGFSKTKVFIAHHVPDSVKLSNTRDISKVIFSIFIITSLLPFICTVRITSAIRIIFLVFFLSLIFIMRNLSVVLLFLETIDSVTSYIDLEIFIISASIHHIPFYWSKQWIVEIIWFL